jgi:hypothetical protein
MAELSRQALLAQLTPDEFTGGKVMAPPSLSQLPQAGKMDSFLNTLGPAAAIGGGIAGLMGQQKPPAASPMEAPAPAAGTPSAMTTAELDRIRKQLDPSF